MSRLIAILGAPKCGTTSLYHWLGKSTQVETSNSKEPHYYSERYRLTDEETYRDLFRKDKRFHIDSSVWYFYHYAWRQILQDNPDALFIVLLRKPEELIQSMHSQQIFNGNERIKDINDALKLNQDRLCGKGSGVRPGYPTDHLAYLNSCLLNKQLNAFYNEVPKENRRVYLLEDMKNDSFHRDICSFLRLTDIDRVDFVVKNTRRLRKSILIDRLIYNCVSVKNLIGLRIRFNVLASIRGWNTKSANKVYDHLVISTEMRIQINNCVREYETKLRRDLSDWYV